MRAIPPDSAVNPATLVELLGWRALHQPRQRAYTFLLDGETTREELTYGELARRAQAIGAALQELGAAGERALLLYPPGLDYIAAFFGCLYAGVVAVPAYPPDPARLERTLPRLHAIVADARPMVTLTTSPILALATALSSRDSAFQSMRWLATDALADDLASAWVAPVLNGTTLAFLQYTSGSTAAPKGVMLTHANLLHNSALIQRAFEHSPSSVGVIWLPPYHDMGLIGGIVQPLYAGFPVVLMSPIAFLQRPLRWLQAIGREQATTSGGPNFAYDLCVRKASPDQVAALDLSSWRVAFNGAEPIRADTLERFAAMFGPRGFRREAFFPCYGLAEATLIVSGGQAAAAPIVRTFQAAALDRNRAVELASDRPDGRRLVGCGQALAQQRVAIVDPETRCRCQPGQIGEIWAGGPSVAQGYWRCGEETAYAFHAFVADTGESPLLRTGDLGFVQEGELFITGRLKDLIIVRGRNLYPQDIELTVERSHAALRPGSCAAFAVEAGGEERLVVIQEVAGQLQQADLDAVTAAIRRAVADRHELHIYAIVLLKPGSIPKTSSGKIQRHVCRAGFLAGNLEAIGSSVLEESADEWTAAELTRDALLAAAPDARRPLLAAYLREQVARVLHAAPSRVDLDQPVSGLGIDSLMAVELQHAIETDLGAVVSMVHFLQDLSIAQIADAALTQLAAPAGAEAVLAAARGASGEHPLSFGQRALWFLHRLAPDSIAYNIPIAVRIRGELDIPALRRAFDKLAERHPSLRTTFAVAHGAPVQQIHAAGQIAFEEQDAAGWSTEMLHKHLVAVAHQPFDLEHGPLLRVRVFTYGPQEHVLLLVVYHIVADLWSLVVLAHELNALYPAECAGRAVTLAPLPIDYTDWARWQDDLLAGPEGQRLWDYWRRQLASPLPVLDLPIDRPRPPVQTYRGAAQTFTLRPGLVRQLKSLAHAAGTTLYTTILAACQALLYRYSGQEDILIGCATTGRNRAELADVVGYFVNLIPMRAELSGNPPFAAFLAQMRQTVLEGFAHQDYPLSIMVERLQPERDPSRSPLFQVVCVLQRAHLLDDAGLTAFALGESGAQMQLGGLALESIALEERGAPFELTLMMAEVEAGIVGSLQYNADLFDAATIARMTGHLQTLLEGIGADPSQRLAVLPLLTDSERHQMLVIWNDSRADAPQEQRIHQLFEAQAERAPHAVAVVFRDAQLTYRELDRRANQLAHYLRALGVGPEVRVGLCVERSLEMIVGILGILKAGGAYVPLDPQYPPARLAFMLEDTRAPVLLTTTNDERRTTNDERPTTDDRPPTTDQETRGQGDKGTGQSLILALSEANGSNLQSLDNLETQHSTLNTQNFSSILDLWADWDAIGRMPTEHPANLALGENNVYVIYTSGSTGRPKGVMVKHRGLVNLCFGLRAYFDDAAVRNTTLITSISFDISVNQIFPTLVFGRTLHIIPDDVKLNSQALVEYIDSWQIHLMDCVPSYLNAVLTDMRSNKISNQLKYILIGGEKIEKELLQKVFGQLGDQVVMVNIYGLTEITDINSLGEMVAGDLDKPVTIGRPLQNNRIYILNSYGSLQPAGISGELCISGESLSRGYLNRPDLTAEKFAVCPFEDGALMCKTGDVGRWLPDGTIELFGRRDHQVKVRGFRIEVGEIEMVLEQHTAVREAVVVAREDTPGERRLVAYVVPKIEDRGLKIEDSGPAVQESLSSIFYPLSSELRAFLQARLPAYMVPAALVVLAALPLTPNGKLDRRALPAPELSHTAGDASYIAPRTPAEAELARIWAELLQVPQVGIHDDFFALGGHSLLAAKAITRACESFEVELPLQSLFEAPTVAALAEYIEMIRWTVRGRQNVQAEAGIRDEGRL